MTITDLLIHGAEKLEGVSTLPFLDAEVLMAFILEKNRAYVIAHSSDVIGIVQERQYNNLISRRATGEPIAYITGYKEFYGMHFAIDERVLVPRPETEYIVDTVKKVVEERYGRAEHARVLEIGTGSGCISIALSKTLGERVHVVATDISLDALELAQENAEGLGATVEFLHGSVYKPLPEGIAPFDIIVSNPPYIDPASIRGTSPETASLRHEPPHALFADDAGFAIVQELLVGAKKWLLPYGVMILEIGENHGTRVEQFASEHLAETHRVELISDFGGKTRFAILWPTTK